MRTILVFAVVLLALLPGSAKEAAAQAGKAAIGGAVGVAGGAVITLSIVVARARFQGEYLEGAEDLIHWQSVPMILTPAVGVMFGASGSRPLKQSVLGSTSGMLLGTALGAGIGWAVSKSPEAPWAGGVIGAGVGMTVGGLLLGIRAMLRNKDDGEPSAPARVGVRVPL